MTTQTLIEKVREQIGPLDSQSEQAVAAAMKILRGAQTEPPSQSPEEKFLSHNITLEEYKALPREEKSRYHDEAEELNWRWVEKQLNSLQAKWLMVVDGQVVLHGATLKNFPDDDELLALCEKTGKYPFAFFSPKVFAIEEPHTTWHTTKDPDDVYPAVAIALLGNNNRVQTEADLNTGAVDCYAALELLTQSGIIEVLPEDLVRMSKHLGQTFFYFTYPVQLELKDAIGKNRQCQTTVICVNDWSDGPFTAINPTRTVLLGRSVLLELQPRLVLDFAARRTEVQFVEAASQFFQSGRFRKIMTM
ncbi:MAG: hypothetical protein ONB46_08875 [candidate division KSB1 bacterium]|nr:hypothetical protein [candidate division KSB1 bacterium]MDZ7365863.1 hypothetical protein [candidate division KSB1 bacterium]MDZ7403902.1 hypothetical protein [candidate division KSB1 bacterium]